MKKHLLTLALGLTLPLWAWAQSHEEGESFTYENEGVTYTFTVISNTDMTMRLGDWGCAVEGASGEVSIPGQADGYTLVELGRESLRDLSDVTRFTIPATVTAIGEEAFTGCSSLTQIDLPAALARIDYGAFSNCESLEQMDLSSYSLTTVGGYLFDSCTGLKQLKLPTTLTAIPDGLCYSCSSLELIEIPQGVKSIGNSAFNDCDKLQRIDIPEGVTSIGTYAFAFCGYENGMAYDADWDEYVGSFAVTIPSTVSSIGTRAFNSCPLAKVTCAIREPYDLNNVFNTKCDAVQSLPLYVATGCQAKYEAVTGWEIFDEIIEIEMGEATDVSVTLADVLRDGTNGESYQIRDELLVYDQFSVTTTTLLPVTTYYIMATDGQGNNIRLRLASDKYKNLQGVATLAAKSVSGKLNDRDTAPWLEVSSQPTEGDGEQGAEMGTADLATVEQVNNVPFTATAFVSKDGKLYASQALTGNSYVPSMTYMPGVTLQRGATYVIKAFFAAGTLYVYNAEQTDDPVVDFSVSLEQLLASGTSGESYTISDQLYKVYQASVEVNQFIFSTTYAQAYATDGAGNWIAVRFPNAQSQALAEVNTLAARSLTGTLGYDGGNPYLNVTSAPVAGDDATFTDLRTLDLNEKFDVKPCEVFRTTAYYAVTNAGYFVPTYLGDDKTNESDYTSVMAEFEIGTKPFNNGLTFEAGTCYDLTAVMALQAAWGTGPFSYTYEASNWYKNVRFLPIEATVHTTAPVRGDLNGDGVVDVVDVNELINAVLAVDNHPRFDIDGDGKVDVADVNTLINLTLS